MRPILLGIVAALSTAALAHPLQAQPEASQPEASQPQASQPDDSQTEDSQTDDSQPQAAQPAAQPKASPLQSPGRNPRGFRAEPVGALDPATLTPDQRTIYDQLRAAAPPESRPHLWISGERARAVLAKYFKLQGLDPTQLGTPTLAPGPVPQGHWECIATNEVHSQGVWRFHGMLQIWEVTLEGGHIGQCYELEPYYPIEEYHTRGRPLGGVAQPLAATERGRGWCGAAPAARKPSPSRGMAGILAGIQAGLAQPV